MVQDVAERIHDLLERYKSLPRISIVRDSLENEMSLLIADCMETNDDVYKISSLLEKIDLSEWEAIK